jgi:hypothetical protein
MKKTRLVGIAAGMAALGLLATSCLTETTYTGATDGGKKVAIMGDAITYQTRDEYHAELDNDYQVRLSGWGGKTFDEFETQQASAFDGDNPDVVVIALGSEDIITGSAAHATEDVTMAAIGRMYDRFPSACTIGVTVNEHMVEPHRDLAEAARINAAIRARATYVVEWSDEANGHPEYFTDGDIIPNAAGKAALTGLVHDAVVLCLPVIHF